MRLGFVVLSVLAFALSASGESSQEETFTLTNRKTSATFHGLYIRANGTKFMILYDDSGETIDAKSMLNAIMDEDGSNEDETLKSDVDKDDDSTSADGSDGSDDGSTSDSEERRGRGGGGGGGRFGGGFGSFRYTSYGYGMGMPSIGGLTPWGLVSSLLYRITSH